jgi:hypothetical protein
MKRLILGLAAVVLLATGTAQSSEGVTPMLKMNTTYHFVFGTGFELAAPLPGTPSGAMWALAWEGSIQGDVNGVIRWWVQFVPPDQFKSVGRFEIWNCELGGCDYEDTSLLLMAGYEVFGYVSATDWEGKGIVTFAHEDYAEWLGRRYADGGWVQFVGGFPFYGEGPFVIYNRPSNKH